ncbi:MAG TPA: class I SAM-dependent methyltransferase [Gemmatimonadales bacterium]|nr:class I SAM-dependent methyltransferase [Gemmatimonadales bacterium]
MSVVARLLGQPWAYRLWQAPFAEQKLSPVFAHNDLSQVRRVLDVGCGPGTNTPHFARADYLGIDYNPGYIASARRRYGRNFIVADVTTFVVPAAERFDFILANSLLHHVDTPGVARVLAHLGDLVSADGHVHILDLVLPDHPSLARLLARWDRGEFPRPLVEWQQLFTARFETVVFEPFTLSALGVPLWHMVYFKGRARA